MPKVSTIAIDGPAGSGKSTVGEKVARSLGYLFFDSGVVYRAVTWIALQRGIDLTDENAVCEVAASIKISVLRPTSEDSRPYTVLANGEDVTWQIFLPLVDASVSVVSAHSRVRRSLLEHQQLIARQGQVVMVGRDIGTVVAPNADLKIYLDASVEIRAERRWLQARSRGLDATYEQILGDLRRRDKIDSEREAAPLKVADDAIVLNTDNYSVDEEVDAVMKLIQRYDP